MGAGNQLRVLYRSSTLNRLSSPRDKKRLPLLSLLCDVSCCSSCAVPPVPLFVIFSIAWFPTPESGKLPKKQSRQKSGDCVHRASERGLPPTCAGAGFHELEEHILLDGSSRTPACQAWETGNADCSVTVLSPCAMDNLSGQKVTCSEKSL